ncbi:hypothetical protein Pfo_005221 [Paulownia fortunei]|nr:hypothetical protein Pfo_005221 [Paulownia fortunei]
MSEHIKVHNESMVDEFECRLAVGQMITNHKDAYLLCCEYRSAKGFSVRKWKQTYFHDYSEELYMKEFDFSCNGTKDEKRSAKNKQLIYLKMETKTGCTAKRRIGRKKNEEWRMIIFDIEHNHNMVVADQRYMLRSAQSHGRKNVGFLKKDAYDYLNRLAKDHKQVENGDAAELLRYFKNKSNKDVLFKDARCRIDYEAFGDVLSINTTYKINKYNLICAPFIGINHHMHNVMFRLTFMSDKTEASFQWLFNTFLKSIGGKQLEIIFTDQCQEMLNAIETWHINQNAPSHFGSLNNNSSFKNMFHKCMGFCESKEEFEEMWSKMIVDYNLYDHSWLNNMYRLRPKWSTAFNKNRFNAGLKATSRSEGTNSTLKDGGKRTHTLFECVLRFERVQNKWHQDEKKNDFKCRRGMPTLVLRTNYLLRDVVAVYTHLIYDIFQSKLINALGIDFDGQPSHTSTLTEFKVRSQGESNRVRKVEFDTKSHEINCTCILSLLRCIKIRWTKSVRERVSFGEEYLCASDHESETVYVNHTMKFCYDLTMRSQINPEVRNLVRNGLKSVLSNLNSLLDSLSMNDLTTCCDNMGLESFKARTCNPLYVKAKGVNYVRSPNHWDSESKSGKGNIESSKRTTKGTKRKVQSSRIPKNAHPSHWLYHMPSPTMLVGHDPSYNFGQFSPNMFHYRDPNLLELMPHKTRNHSKATRD